jgi:hypothetical protein
MEFITQQLFFYFAIVLILFLPGWFLLNLIEVRKKYFSLLEKFVLSFPLSIIIANFLLIGASLLGFSLNRKSVFLAIFIFTAAALLAGYGIRFYKKSGKNNEVGASGSGDLNLSFSRRESVCVILLIFLSIFIRAAYLKDAVLPTSTDLGHHMYWSKLVAETGELPVYQEMGIIESEGKYALSEPEKIDDFIIGEHLIFSAVNSLSGAQFFSSFPILLLFLVNIFTILSIFIFCLAAFRNEKNRNTIAILSLLFIGPLYAISSPQAKFISGGVIGNNLGSLFLPVIFYFYLRSFQEKNCRLFILGSFLTFGLFYTHHLSALIFLFAAAASALLYFIFNIRNLKSAVSGLLKTIARPAAIIFLLAGFIFMFAVYPPGYFEPDTVKTAVGKPEKSTRTGLSFSQLSYASGEARMLLGAAGIIIIAFTRKRKEIGYSLALGWAGAILLMSLKPQLLMINIPSGRIGNYASFPLAILAGYSISWLANVIRSSRGAVRFGVAFPSLLLLLFFAVTSGMYDNSQSLKTTPNAQPALETHRASEFLAEKTGENDLILKDHNYLVADSWIKLYFMKDYKYPLSRGYFKRYDDEFSEREMCTLWMISTPNLEQGKKCLYDLGVNFVMVNPLYDSSQFEKSKEFEKVYTSSNIAIFHRN